MNGKLRDTIEVTAGIEKDKTVDLAKKYEKMVKMDRVTGNQKGNLRAGEVGEFCGVA